MFNKFIITLSIFTSTLFAVDFDFFTDYEKALTKSQTDQKIVMLMISSNECPMCNYMKNTVFEAESVVNYIEANYHLVEMQIEEKRYPEQFKAFATPTFYFIDPKTEKKIGRQFIGGAKPSEFLAKLKEIKKKRK
ncbi:MAG: thioredoxin family protein [Epsilonproteobacteria bacterium]|nr:thioredoxin family protein [Campylobacterota bacterium]